MAGRDLPIRSEPGFSLPAFARLAPPPPPELVAARIETYSSLGDVVVDLHGRGGWVARAAVDRQRRAASLETNPLTRLLAEVVLRPPDVRHLDAAFQAIAAAPREQSALKVWLGEKYASRCGTCGRSVVLDEIVWETVPETGPRPVHKHYRCTACRDQVGGADQRHGSIDDADLARIAATDPRGPAWRAIRDRFPTVDGDDGLVEQLLDLHTPRQLVGLQAILERIEGDLRSAPVEAAMRLALLHALLPASRLNGYPGRIANLRISGGRIRLPAGGQWRERNPWLAFEDGFRLVRGFVQRLEGAPLGLMTARFGEDLQSLTEGMANVVVRLGTPSSFRSLEAEADALARLPNRPRVRLVLGQPPQRPNVERLSYAYFATGWVLGRDAASLLPLEAVFGGSGRAPWGWQSAAIRRAFDAAAPLLARDGRAILIVEPGGPEGLLAAALGGVAAGYRLVGARLAEPGEETGGTVEFVPPGATVPVGPRSRANVPLPHLPGGAGDPETVPGRGLFAPPERFDRVRSSEADVARTVTETTVEILQARGEPARFERLLGEILVGLDRAGQLRRLVAPRGGSADRGEDQAETPDGVEAWPGGDGVSELADRPVGPDRAGIEGVDGPTGERAAAERVPSTPEDRAEPDRARPDERRAAARAQPTGVTRREPAVVAAGDQVDRLLAIIRDELGRPSHRRLQEIEPGRWWLTDPADIAAAALPLADRVEWAVFSLLSTGGRLSEAAFNERIAALFTGHDLPDEALVAACLESYRSLASTPERIVTADDLLRRSHEHSEIVADLVDTGHRLGMRAWIASREQVRRVRGRHLADWLDDGERRQGPPRVGRARPDDVDQIDVVWQVRGRASFLFEVEWTAMLGEPLLRRGALIPSADDIVRFLVVAPERTELLRYKLERSPLLRSAMETGNWYVLKSNHLRAYAARETVTLADLEPYVGLDPAIEHRGGEQMPLFAG
jgi:hypothetical protein